MLTLDGVTFYEADLLVLRALEAPVSPDAAVAEAVRLGATPSLARGTLERLWIIGAVEKDRHKVKRSAFGDAVMMMGAGM